MLGQPAGALGLCHERVDDRGGPGAPGPPRRDRRPDPDQRARDRRVVAARPPRGRRLAAAARRRDPARLRWRSPTSRPPSRASASWPRAPTWSTSRGCAARRGGSGSRPRSTPPTWRPALERDQRGHRPPPRGLRRRGAAAGRLAGLAPGMGAGGARVRWRRGSERRACATARDVQVTLRPVPDSTCRGSPG